MIATDANMKERATWAMREMSAGNRQLDCAEAVKLAMVKAREQHWSHIKVGALDQQLLRHLKSRRAKDTRLFYQVEDIYGLS